MNKRLIENRMGLLRKRMDRVTVMWVSKEEVAHRKKCMALYNKMSDEVTILRDHWFKIEEREKQEKDRFDNSIILLSCHSFKCELGLGMTMKAYNELAEYPICENCGREMISEEDMQLKIILLQSGVEASF